MVTMFVRIAWQAWMAEHRLKALRRSLQMHVEQKGRRRLMSEVNMAHCEQCVAVLQYSHAIIRYM